MVHGLKPLLTQVWEWVCVAVKENGLKSDLGYSSVNISGPLILSKDLELEFLAVFFNNKCCIPGARHTEHGVLLCARQHLHHLELVVV